jgi:FimV-like protein
LLTFTRYLCVSLAIWKLLLFSTLAYAVEQEKISYTVKRGEVISQLGFSLRPDNGVTGAQMSVALYRYNPDSFLHRDIHRLLIHSTLTIPSKQQALQISYERSLRIIKGREDAKSLLSEMSPDKETIPISEKQPDAPSLVLAIQPTINTQPTDISIHSQPTIHNEDLNQLVQTIVDLQLTITEQYSSAEEVTQLVKSSVEVMNSLQSQVQNLNGRIQSIEQRSKVVAQQPDNKVFMEISAVDQDQLNSTLEIAPVSASTFAAEIDILPSGTALNIAVNLELSNSTLAILVALLAIVMVFIFKQVRKKSAKSVPQGSGFNEMSNDELLNLSFDDIDESINDLNSSEKKKTE